MASRQKTNLNNRYKLNSRLIYMWCDERRVLVRELADQVGAHPSNLRSLLYNQRIPRPEVLKKIQDRTGLAADDLLLPLVGGGRG